MALVGREAPDFDVKAVVDGTEIVDSYTLSQFRGNKYVLLFFYPLDFTFVCPTELHAFQEKLSLFEEKGVQVIGCSVDSWHTHYAWLTTPKNKGGIEGVTYPLLSDLNKELSTVYGVLADEGMSFRGQFLIDKEGIVRHELVNDLPIGRNVDEALRIIDALQFNEQHGEVCPANWEKGQRTMSESRESVELYFNSEEKTINVK